MDLDTITPLILTFNEEANIGRVLDRLSWASRILVIDSFSTDGTLEIVARYPQVDVIQHPFESFADQCNFGLGHVDTDWVLSLDPDYVCPLSLPDELDALPPKIAEAYAARFRYCVFGKPLNGTLYPPRTVLYRRSAARYEQDGHAHRVTIDGRVGMLESVIDHDDRKPLDAWLNAQRRYARQEATKLLQTPPDELGTPDRIRRMKVAAPILAPLYALVAKGTILNGKAGVYYALQRAYAELLLSIELLDASIRGDTEHSAENDDTKITNSVQSR